MTPSSVSKKKLIDKGVITEAEADAIDKAADQTIEDAYVFAESSPEPSVDTIMEGVYA